VPVLVISPAPVFYGAAGENLSQIAQVLRKVTRINFKPGIQIAVGKGRVEY